MSERTWTAQSGYRYGFNGHEKLNYGISNCEIRDFGARNFDSRLAIFYSIDPKFVSYPYSSTYTFSFDNPIRFIDLNGEGPEDASTGDPSRISFSYMGLSRTQNSGSGKLHFSEGHDLNYIRPFSGTRFSPDEPSSFSMLEFSPGKLSSSNLRFSIGGYRDHIKGGLDLPETGYVHFGKGNSQIGIGIGFGASQEILKTGIKAEVQFFGGVGINYSRFQGGLSSDSNDPGTDPDGTTISPSRQGNPWGVRGNGGLYSLNVGIELPYNINSIPKISSGQTFGGKFLRAIPNALISTVNGACLELKYSIVVQSAHFDNFTVTDNGSGLERQFSNLNYTTMGQTLNISLNWNLK
jgi:hypothetical protein